MKKNKFILGVIAAVMAIAMTGCENGLKLDDWENRKSNPDARPDYTALYKAGAKIESLINDYDAEVEDLLECAKDYVVGTEGQYLSWDAGPNTLISDGETQTIYFVNYGSGANLYNNFLLECFGVGDEGGYTLRCDNYGWSYQTNNASPSKLLEEDPLNGANSVKSKKVEGTLDWVALAKGQIVKVVVTNGAELKFECTSPSQDGWKQTYILKNANKIDVNWHLQVDGSYLIALKDN